MVERSQPRHVDRRDQGMRRQRRITQWTALGSAALIAVFGWIFAQPGTASAGNEGGSTGGASGGGAAGTATKPKPSPTKAAKAPKAPKSSKSTKTQPTATLEPPPAPPAETRQQPAPDTRTGAS